MQSQTELDAGSVLHTDQPKHLSPLLTYRLMIIYRFLLAIVGGYALASYSAMVIAKTFAEQRSDAVLSATLLAFCIYCAAFIWVFIVKKTLKASLGIVLPTLILWAITTFVGN